jgi:hypothetical protein
MKKKYSSPVFRYLDLLQVQDENVAEPVQKEDQTMATLSGLHFVLTEKHVHCGCALARFGLLVLFFCFFRPDACAGIYFSV